MPDNPFSERGRITNPERFAGRWGELSLLFDRLDARWPVLVTGVAGIGKSSLLTHVVQSAAVNLERPDLRAFYLDMARAQDAAQIYATLIEALGERGSSLAALEVALVAFGRPVLLCLDNAHLPLAAGWGDTLLEALARLARSGALMLVAAVAGPAPLLSERFAAIALGALAPAEVRLLAEAYLEGTDISFSPRELDELATLSAGHPAYLQRAAYHLFRHKLDPQVQWRQAYLAEARERPIPGAPLPPAVFEGHDEGGEARSTYALAEGEQRPAGPGMLPIPEAPALFFYGLPVTIGAFVAATGNPVPGAAIALLGAGALWAWRARAGK